MWTGKGLYQVFDENASTVNDGWEALEEHEQQNWENLALVLNRGVRPR